MSKYYAQEKWYELARILYEMIDYELDRAIEAGKDAYQVYPQLVVAYEFFRLVRGESFYDFRPPAFQKQKELYRRENDLGKKLDNVKKQLDLRDERARLCIEQTFGYWLGASGEK